jgi:hypothetical protein
MGAWVAGDARTNSPFSATVQLYSGETTVAGACAYASSYPPVGQYVSESEIVFSGTPWYELKLLHEDGYTVETIESGSTFLLPCSYTVSSFTDATGAPGIIKCLAPANLMFATPYTTICAGATVTLTASATGAASYSIDGSEWKVSPVFEVAPASNESYTLYAKTAEGCVTSVADAAVVTVYPAVLPGEIATAATTTMAGINPNVTIASLADASDGSGNITYEWRRTGTSSATMTGSAATYAIGNDVSNHTAAGTYYFNRYAQDAMCTDAAPVAATGTYTLYVDIPKTLCTQCCYDGVAPWVDCHVTSDAYPFNNSTNSTVVWSGNGNTYYSGARSPYDGRANTVAVSTYTATSAIGICKNLGDGWYLPAYEELVNMSTGGKGGEEYAYSPLNGRSGASLLAALDNMYWSSTEFRDNGGRYNNSNAYFETYGVGINYAGILVNLLKTTNLYVRCAWRP